MEQSQVLEWFCERIDFLKKNQDVIATVNIYNRTKTVAGKTYYRIYFDIDTNLISKNFYQMTNEEKELDNSLKLINCQTYIHFYDNHYKELEVEINYRWIISLFKLLVDKKINYKIERYVKEPRLN